MGFRRLGRILVITVKAVIACRCQRAAPTLTTIFEIAALTAPLIKAPNDAADAAGSSTPVTDVSDTALAETTPAGQASNSHYQHQRGPRPDVLGPPATAAHVLLAVALRLARGWAPAVVLAQGVRLVGSLVQKREHPNDEPRQEGTEVRALQLGLSVVPRVDPRAHRTLEQYANIYREWLLLLRGRLAQSGLELPEGLFDPGLEGDEELMRFALCYNLLQARSLKDALVAMDRTISNIKEFAAWYKKYPFITPVDLEAWQRIAWWEGPDDDGHLWLMIDFRAAVNASRTHGADLVARVLVSNMEYGVRQLIPELGCAGTLRVVVDTSGVHIGAALRMRGVFHRVGHIIDRMYPCRLQVLYMVGLPFPLRWTFKASMQLLHVHTRRKIRLCRATDVPRRLPSQLRSHKLSVAAGLDTWALHDTQSYYGDGPLDSSYFAEHTASAAAGGALDNGGAAAAAAANHGSAAGSDYGGPEMTPFTPRTPMEYKAGGGGRQRGGGLRGLQRFRWRKGAAAAGAGGNRRTSRDFGGGAAGVGSSSASRRRLLRARLVRGGLLALGAMCLLLVGYLVLLQQLVPETSELMAGRLMQLLMRIGANAARSRAA